MNKNFSVVMIAVATLIASSQAMAMGSFSVAGGVNMGLTKLSGGGVEVKGGMGYDVGLMMNHGMGSNSLEIGAFYEHTVLTVTGSPDTTANQISIPVMLRFGGMWSLGVGGYYDIPMTSGNSSDYGLVAGPRLSLPGGLFFDARYEYGLKSQDDPLNPGSTFHGTGAVLLVGYKFK